MFFEIDFESEVPIYLQIRNEIIKAIAKGKLKEGDKLPPVRVMAGMIDVNLHTINKAYNLLKAEGYVLVDRRRGVVVKITQEDSFNLRFQDGLELMLSEGIVKGLTEEEVITMIKEKYMEIRESD